MFQAMKKYAMFFPVIALWSCAAVSQPTPSPAPTPTPAPTPAESRAFAEKFIRPNNGVAAIVFDEKGRAIVVNKEGQLAPACLVCTTELERKYGPQCAKAPKVSEIAGNKSSMRSSEPAICNKLMGTNVQAVKPFTVLKHTGSECMSFFFDNDGFSEVFQICW